MNRIVGWFLGLPRLITITIPQVSSQQPAFISADISHIPDQSQLFDLIRRRDILLFLHNQPDNIHTILINSVCQEAIIDKLLADPRVKTFRLTLRGHSMDPFLKPGTQAEFQKISLAKLPEIGDIAAIKFQNRLLVHRIVSRRFRNRGWEFFTQGDRLATGDGWITKDKIAGIMMPPATLQSAVYYPQILKLKTAMEAAKINFVFLKGLPLYLYFTKSNPQRVLADCDVLIDKKDRFKAEKIFSRLGYQLAESAYSKFHQRLKDKLTEVTYFRIIKNCLVAFDIHFEVVFLMNQLGRLEALYPQRLVDDMTQQFLRQKQQVKIKGGKFPILSPANLIIYLGLHFFHHNFTGRHRLEFWHRVVNYYKLGTRHCEESVEKIKRYRLQNFIYPGFALLNKHFPKTMFARFMAQIRPDPKVLKYAAKIADGFRRDSSAPPQNDEGRLTVGVARFKNIFFLSPYPWRRKILVFLNPAVIYSVIWLIAKKLLRR